MKAFYTAASLAASGFGLYKISQAIKKPDSPLDVYSSYSVVSPTTDKRIGGVHTRNEGLHCIADYIKQNPGYRYYKIYAKDTKEVIWWGDSWKLQSELRKIGSHSHTDISRHNAQSFFRVFGDKVQLEQHKEDSETFDATIKR